MREWLAAIAAGVVALALVALARALFGHSPSDALSSLVRGSLDETTLNDIPLLLRATGFNPHAARFAGINVDAQIFRAMAISGGCAGLAGGIELLGVTHRLFERFASGYGYSGIAVALLAQLHPLATLVSAFFFGALTTGAGELQRSANISSTIATFGQAIVILTVLGFGAFHARD